MAPITSPRSLPAWGICLAASLISLFAIPGTSEAQGFGDRLSRCVETLPEIKADIQKKPYVLVSQKPSGGPSSHEAGGEVQGLAVQPTGYTMKFAIEAIPVTSGGYCARVKEVEIRLGEIAPSIWVDPSIRPGTCRYNVVMDHERRHVAHYYAYLDEFRRAIPSLSRDFQRQNAVSVPDGIKPDAAYDRLTSAFTAILASYNDQALRRMRAKDVAIDTREEYARLSALCR